MHTTLISAVKEAQELADRLGRNTYIGTKSKQYYVTDFAPASFKWTRQKLEFVRFVKPSKD